MISGAATLAVGSIGAGVARGSFSCVVPYQPMIPIKSIWHHGRTAEVFDAMGIVKPRWGLGASGVPVPQGAR